MNLVLKCFLDDNVVELLLLADRYEVTGLFECLAYARYSSRLPLVDKFIMAEKYSDKEFQVRFPLFGSSTGNSPMLLGTFQTSLNSPSSFFWPTTESLIFSISAEKVCSKIAVSHSLEAKFQPVSILGLPLRLSDRCERKEPPRGSEG